MAKYQFKEGRECLFYGAKNVINNTNLTDDLAEHLIKSGKAKKEDFKIKTTNKK